MTVQYQGVWSLQSAAQLQSTQRWVTDPLYKNTTLLLQADDAANGAQNNTFLDSSSNSFAITRNGNTTQGSFTPFSQAPGRWGNYFDGSSGISTADSADFTFGSGDFTIQCWVFSTVGGSLQWLAGQGASNAANTSISFAIQKTANNKLNPSVFTGGTQYQITSTGDLQANQWVHIAFVRDGNTCRLYINGVQDGTVSVTGVTVNDSSNQVAIGQLGEYVTNRYTGYVSNFSIIKGTCSYPSGATFTVPASPLSASATNQSFLTCTANGFIDTNTATTAKTITVAGTPSVQAFSPFAPQFQWTPSVIGGSGYFDGTTDYLTGNGQLSSSASMSTFTVEGWLYPTTLGNNFVIGDMDATGATNVLSIRTGNSGDLVLYWYDGATKECYSPNGSLRVNQWNYFAIVVNSNAISMYINSTTAASLTGTTTLTNRTQTSNFAVGQINNAQNYPGYIGSLRWSNGIARTISAIPTAPYTSDANTRLLLNFTNAGIFDGTMKNNLETVGNAQVSTAVVKYGSGSMFFDGTGDYLRIPTSQTNSLGSGSWTIEFWVYRVGSGNQIFYDQRSTATQLAVTIFNDGNNILRFFVNGANQISDTGTFPASTWTHVAVAKLNSSTRMFVNGVQVGSTYADTNTYVNNPIFVGAQFDGSGTLNGYIDDLRVTTGIARYTQNFIPPSVALPRQ